MSNFEDRLEVAEERVARQAEAAIAAATAAVSRPGEPFCIECGVEIQAARLTVAPFARRCIECQELLEAERYHR